MQERLQKIIARAGVASRRRAEELITSGQVAVNGKIVTELGSKADAEGDHIRVAGKLLRLEAAARETKVTIALNKPDGVVSTMRDPEGRRSIASFLRGIHGRVFPIGRLEFHASGLLLLTNDGELANRVMRAHSLVQHYLCKIEGALGEGEIRDLQQAEGVKMQRAKGMPAGWWEVKISAASRDAFRRALLTNGHHVDKLKRIALGPVELGPLAPGEYRHLSSEDLAELGRALDRAERKPPAHERAKPRKPFTSRRKSGPIR